MTIFLKEFLQKYQNVKSPQDKMVLTDTLIHRYHWEIEGGLTRPGATDQLQGLVMLFLDMHSHGYDLGLLFFGLFSILLGYLVVKSGYFPKILGYGLIAAAIVYLAGSFTRFLFPDYLSLILPVYIVPLIAELSFCLWLLVKGVKVRP